MFSERLKLLRLEAGLTQKDIAQQLKISQPSYADWERGKKNPTQDKLTIIAKFYDVSVDYLLGNTDDKHSDKKNLSTFDILFRKTSKNLNEREQKELKEDLEAFLAERSKILKERKKQKEDDNI
ncbi:MULTISPECIES: helix-turn-helix transcriptional regulator [unclassified Enterococcus]|uniref:helix-turn-helix domain-containing protein n=1 Tax=unclassified Enterococcus TaxID=2608891 RepID=UPI00155797AD|nr:MULTISPECIES: helix-turn-helix transcriptional regulator [unclassified Enterococcus]MBS7576950.1 helix-turn-helix transcriptional regulator [Enterococcus sp. MMGLQ5-2]MBS7584357.1 helix-turn-helix transcriptional regulator [Enterococcus sp. MMGLQ5-1]NPD12212.1 helix-turn-helix transcriptional regulator [Enterococcus sp. MMGLQ5-1]NPD36784.1 helix-turn-helix transcriptional regulator [Enterococcus sp. MMGLQ5-2]